jgi:hypothetical protein
MISTLLEAKAHEKLEKDPSDSIKCKTGLLLKKSPFAEEVCQQLWPQDSRPLRLYGLLKIHKPDVPLRCIVSIIGPPMYRLAQHLEGLLSYLTGHFPHHVKISTEFVILGSLRVDTRDIMVSFFTRVSINETMDLLEQHFEEDILRIFRHILTTSCFIFNGQFTDRSLVWQWAQCSLRS